MIYRSGEPFALLYWDDNVDACPPSTPEHDEMVIMDKIDFETHQAFETFPVMTMGEYVESMCGLSEDEIRDGATIHYGNTLTVELY
jgi:hypothetical protein